MTAINLILALLAVAGLATVALLGFLAGHGPDHGQRPAEDLEQDRALELAA
jgi:hypothetical protein